MPRAQVHVVCGGGTGSRLLRVLVEHEFQLSTGILAPGDADADVARELGIPVVLSSAARVEPDSDTIERARGVISAARAIVLTPFAVGKGNLVNLALASELSLARPLFLLEGLDIAERDYTHGEASRLVHEMEPRVRGRARTPAALVPMLGPALGTQE